MTMTKPATTAIEDGMGFAGLVESPEERQERRQVNRTKPEGMTLLDALNRVSCAARDVYDRYGQAASEGIIAAGLVQALSAMEDHLRDEVRRADLS